MLTAFLFFRSLIKLLHVLPIVVVLDYKINGNYTLILFLK